jgi:dolichol kinase
MYPNAWLFCKHFPTGSRMGILFLANLTIKAVSLFLVQYATGLLVVHKGIKVNYTRKINHFALFIIPTYLDRVFAYQQTFGLFVLGAVLVILSPALYVQPLRDRYATINTMFRSFDRPEDQPYTLMWLSTQIFAGFLVIVPMVALFARRDLLDLILVPILINGIGDGLAEPVGVRFGRHQYGVHALFTRKSYVRTLEGSACVFITSIVVIAVHYPFFTPMQYLVALAFLPTVMTLTEAFSPHTWDTPFLFLVGYLALFGIKMI